MNSGGATAVSPVRLLPLGDTAWTIEFGDSIDPALHARVLGLAQAVEQAISGAVDSAFSAIVDVVPTFRSLTVHFNPLLCDGQHLGRALLCLAETAGATCKAGRQWSIPVCFDDDFAPDLNALAQSKGMAREAVIALMTGASFQVYMIGFMPGFPYMGGLPQALEMPRLSSPRKAVPARSLAVTGAMCAVYPWESPGGWRLLGRTPVPMFSVADKGAPALLEPGDRVRWQAIERPQFLAMETALAAGALARASFQVSGESV
jgi:inhibitor of KinA